MTSANYAVKYGTSCQAGGFVSCQRTYVVKVMMDDLHVDVDVINRYKNIQSSVTIIRPYRHSTCHFPVLDEVLLALIVSDNRLRAK